MIKVGTIKEIWRYPVKGMSGEQVEQALLSDMGLVGDRIWALHDTERQEIQSCKFRPQLLQCIATTRQLNTSEQIHVDVLFPDGRIIGSDDPDIHAQLSTITQRASTLEPLASHQDADFFKRHKADEHTWLTELKATFDREDGEPLPDLDNLPERAQNYVVLPGSFFLVTPFHFLTTATLEHFKTIQPDSDWAVSRFRPNVVIETLPGMSGLVEQAWLGKQLKFGDASVACVDSTPRCGAVSRAQQNLPSDATMLRTIVKQADQNLGVYGEVSSAAIIQVGDDVYLDVDGEITA